MPNADTVVSGAREEDARVEGGFTLGVEEEFHLVDPATRSLAPDGPRVLAVGSGEVDSELQCSTVETRTDVLTGLSELHGELRRLREALVTDADRVGRWVVAAGTYPASDWRQQRITPKPRYERMLADYQHLAREQLICGCQTHVGIDDPEVAIHVMNRIRPWLPTLLALSTSSPFWDGTDTGYASYRIELWRRWPTSGIPPRFASRAEYDALAETLVGLTGVADPGMLYWYIRPSARYPTLEFRIADACPRVDEAVLQAGLARALARTCYEEVVSGLPELEVRQEVLALAVWEAARFGLTGKLTDVFTGGAMTAADRVQQLLDYVRFPLEDDGDWQDVSELVQRVLREGTSSQRQRRNYRRTGSIDAVVDQLVAETAGRTSA